MAAQTHRLPAMSVDGLWAVDTCWAKWQHSSVTVAACHRRHRSGSVLWTGMRLRRMRLATSQRVVCSKFCEVAVGSLPGLATQR